MSSFLRNFRNLFRRTPETTDFREEELKIGDSILAANTSEHAPMFHFSYNFNGSDYYIGRTMTSPKFVLFYRIPIDYKIDPSKPTPFTNPLAFKKHSTPIAYKIDPNFAMPRHVQIAFNWAEQTCQGIGPRRSSVHVPNACTRRARTPTLGKTRRR